MEDFNIALKQHAMQEFDRFASMDEGDNQEEIQIDSELIYLLEDKDNLTSKLESSKENIENKLGEKEGDITKQLSEEWKGIETKILED